MKSACRTGLRSITDYHFPSATLFLLGIPVALLSFLLFRAGIRLWATVALLVLLYLWKWRKSTEYIRRPVPGEMVDVMLALHRTEDVLPGKELAFARPVRKWTKWAA